MQVGDRVMVMKSQRSYLNGGTAEVVSMSPFRIKFDDPGTIQLMKMNGIYTETYNRVGYSLGMDRVAVIEDGI